MEFFIAERDWFKMIIAENCRTNEYWTVVVTRCNWLFLDRRPSFNDLIGMKIKVLPDKQAIAMLEKYATNTVDGRKLRKCIDRYLELPF